MRKTQKFLGLLNVAKNKFATKTQLIGRNVGSEGNSLLKKRKKVKPPFRKNTNIILRFSLRPLNKFRKLGYFQLYFKTT